MKPHKAAAIYLEHRRRRSKQDKRGFQFAGSILVYPVNPLTRTRKVTAWRIGTGSTRIVLPIFKQEYAPAPKLFEKANFPYITRVQEVLPREPV